MAAVIVEYSFPPMFENARNEGESESVTAGPDWHTEMSAASVLCLPVFMFYATNCKLHANILSQWVYKENSLICLMETRQEPGFQHDHRITESGRIPYSRWTDLLLCSDCTRHCEYPEETCGWTVLVIQTKVSFPGVWSILAKLSVGRQGNACLHLPFCQ